MTISPPNSKFNVWQPLVISNSVDQTPYQGGDPQRLNRLGDRFGVSVSTPPMRDDGTARAWKAFVMGAQGGDTVLMDWYEGDMPKRGYGTPLVRGAGQTGRSLVIDGLPPNQRIEASKFFSVVNAGKRSLHTLTAQADANSSGIATLNFWPMLPWSPPDDAVIELARPKLQGRMDRLDNPWSMDVNRLVGISFVMRAVHDA